MTTTVSVEEAQSNLPQIIGQLGVSDQVVITQDEQPVARLVPVAPRKLGTLRGSVKYMASDFDAPLEDFKEYSS